MSEPRPIRQHVGAVLIVLMYAFMGIMGTPGMDYMNIDHYDEADEKTELLEQRPFWGHVMIALYTVNRELRRPLMEHIKPLERPFRLAQDWNLYRDGPSRVRRLNIYVDGDLKHRSADNEHGWLDPQLRNRHIRPALENAARKPVIPNWPGIVRFLAERAQEDFPGCEEVRVESTWSRFPGNNPEFKHGYIARAPDWEVVALKENAAGEIVPETELVEEKKPKKSGWPKHLLPGKPKTAEGEDQ